MKTHFCQHCYTKNPESAHICSDCGRVIETPDVIIKEQRMREFADFFMNYPVVREDGEVSNRRQKKFDVQNGIIIYDMGPGRIEWGWFVFLTLCMVLPGIKYLYGILSHLVIVVRFNELGFPIKTSDSDNYAQYRHILDLYMQQSLEYQSYVDKNPNSITRKPYTKRQLIITTTIIILLIILLPWIIWSIALLRAEGII